MTEYLDTVTLISHTNPVPEQVSLRHHEVDCGCFTCACAVVTALRCLEPILRAETEEGIYASRGWTVTKGILPLMLRYSSWICSNPDDVCSHEADVHYDFPVLQDDYIPYHEADDWIAKKLLQRLPSLALEERQNEAPSLRCILNLVLQHPKDATFSGYLIGPQRFDERVSADSIQVSADLLRYSGDDSQVAYRAAQKLDLDMLCPPDEITKHARHGDTCGYWWSFWWD